MKMVAAAKLKRATNAIVQLRPYANKLRDILAQVSASVEGNDSPYTQDRIPTKVLVIVLTSNRGLAGAFNANAIKTANNLIFSKYAEQHARGNLSIIAIGKRGHDFFQKRGFNVIGNYNDLYSDLNFLNVSQVTEYVMKEYKAGNIDRVEVVYNEFRNAAVQILTAEQLLPLVPQETAEVEKSNAEVDYIIEPSKEKIIEELIPKAIKTQLYKAVLDSNASEHGARMTAMDKATENAGDLLKSLKLSYNQARQAAITTELSEIVSGAAALSNG
ncbi:ATP synthase F1 subcomplex gamma subunit [Sphingobacterium paludis]|uniref:ATP synthase gamma chain n=2 Tax=Sphingobacterium paludis TaxID=1476465 RepID=A0A4R7DAB6_9SPHI|nr:ATP synthase F1 subcomplex gamma subunit [Sphingobacterium paludis]